ncbi:MAG: fatty acid cis/trans isomerase [Halioglobus sp.]|nr:fatty acid cis/trans isomerase [Halioglobus sp.]
MPIFRLTGPATLVLALLCVLRASADADYPPAVKPIVERRCMVCHGCYDAPCQLKLDAWAGLQRGANKDKVYDGTRLLTANLTRLFVDAQTPQQWHDKGFYPVIAPENPAQSTLLRMLELKQQHPLPDGAQLPDSFDFALNRDQQCVRADEFDTFATDYPLWGMPYGFPGLNGDEYRTLGDWVRAGAPGVPGPVTDAATRAAVDRWEAFFNGDSLKQQLMSRYIYEHLFIGALYFADVDGQPRYFNLVRSRTPPGAPVAVIATRRPYDAPGSGSFYYRLQPLRTSVIDKRHMPYALDAARMQRWQSLFLDADYSVTRLPGYEPEVAANPFVAFRELPVYSRYQFMLDEAHFTITGFIKGPVCRGQVALNVIDDHFWVVFSTPHSPEPDETAKFLARESDNLRLPRGGSGLLVSLVQWRSYARGQLQFLKAKSAAIKKWVQSDVARITLDKIWDGDGHNDNAALTVFRHNDSASVVKGLVGQQPKTAWVISYSLLERIHYLLVAGFDVYGDVSHQLETRLYMDFLRMEGERNFLTFLPRATRLELRDFWYRDADEHVKKYVLGKGTQFNYDSAIEYRTDDPMREFFQRLQPRLPGADAPRYRVDEPELARLHSLSGEALRLMPEVAFVDVLGARGEDRVFSILHNSAFSNNAQLFREAQRRIPQEDTLTVVKGFIGSYPNQFFQFPERDLPGFVAAIAALRTERDYAALVSRYGVRRNAPWFWKVSDKFHRNYAQEQPLEAGLFDLNRYENR